MKSALGKWITPPSMTWQYHYDEITSQLYDTFNGKVTKLTEQLHFRHTFESWKRCPEPPLNLHAPTEIPTIEHDKVTLRNLAPHQFKPPTPSRYPDFKTQIDNLPNHRKRLIEDTLIKASVHEIFQACKSRKPLLIISDGGLKDTHVTYGWKIVNSSLQTLFAGTGPVDGPTTQSSSTRAELFGLAAPLALLREYCEYHSVPLNGRLK